MRARRPPHRFSSRSNGVLLALLAAAGISLLSLSARVARSQSAAEPVRVAPGGVADWVGEIRRARDVTGKGSWLKRVVKFVVGLDDNQKAMLTPNGVHVDAQGRILVADTRGRVVHVFDRARRRYQALRPPASDPFLAPIAVATDAAGRIYASDSVRSRIYVFSPEGKFLRTIGGLDRQESIFQRSTGLAIDAKRERLYVVDTAAMRVFILSLDGRVLARIGQRGAGPGEFNFPTHIAVAADGSFWVTDSLNFRVQHFDAEGKFLSAFGRLGDRPGDFDKAKGIALDRQGRLYVVEGRNDRVQVYDSDGRLLFVFGQTGNGAGQFFLPTGIATDGGNQIVVADGYNARVQLFRLRPEAAAPSGGN